MAHRLRRILGETGLALLLCSCPLFAQNLPFKPQPTVRVKLTDGTKTWYQPLVVPHRTADRAFWLSTGLSLALTVADVENSHYALNKLGTIEANPVFGQHPGRARYYAICLPIFAVNTYLSYRYKREDDAMAAAGIRGHKYAKWWVPSLANTVVHAVGVTVTLASTGR